jgi:PAS domain-containing protein
MTQHSSAQAAARDRRMILLAGSTAFAVSYGLFHFILPVGEWVSLAPEPIVSLSSAALVSILVMGTAVLLFARTLSTQNLRMRIAINNMSQALCMFDGNERLVVCNRRYKEMYRLSADIVKRGCSL